MLLELVAASFIRVTTPDALTVDLNPDEIVSLRQPRPEETRTLHGKVRCVIFTSDGKFVAVIEECTEIRQLLTHPNGR